MSRKNFYSTLLKLKRQYLGSFPLKKTLVCFVGIIVLVFLLTFLIKPFLDVAAKILVGPRFVSSLFLKNPVDVLKSYDKRTNILILGMAGGEHEGTDLSDTMIFASINLESGDSLLISLPRDIWLDSLKAKINTAYHYGSQEKGKEGGFALAKDAVYQIVGRPIHYAFTIDFTGFVKAIDLVDGIDVLVERSFVDEKYPIAGRELDECGGDPEYRCRYETIEFEKGLQHMDGEIALKFARSRNAEGEEGTDFARAARQQKVILALKDKILSRQTFLSPTKMLQLKNTFADHVKTDKELSYEELAAFSNLFLKFVREKNSLRTLTLDIGTEESPGFLKNPPISKYGHWVLVPRAGDWSEFQEFLKQKLESEI